MPRRMVPAIACARREDKIRLFIKELNSPSFYPNMVMLWVTDSFERKNDIDRDLLAKLLVNLSKSQDSLLSAVELIKGFEAVLSTLEDAVIDSPKAAEYLGRILGKLISEDVFPLGEIRRIMHDGGDEPGNLIETGLASDVLVSILESIKRDRGPTAVSSLNTQQISGLQSLPPQVWGYGTQDIRLEDRHSFESRMPSVPLPQRPIDDDSITLGPQGDLANGMSIKGQPLMPSAPVPDVSPMSGDPRRMTSGPNGYNYASDWVPNSREDLMQRYWPERFATAPAYDKSNSIERSTSFENRDLRNVDCTSDRGMATSLGKGLISSSGVHNFPMQSKLSDVHLQEMSISAIQEYYSARSEDKIRLFIKELNSPSFYPNMVMLWVTDSFERKNDSDRDLLAKLLVNLCRSQDGLLSVVQLIKGFEAVLSTLEDAVTDSPKAAEYLGRILGKMFSENVVPLGEIRRIIHDGGDEPGNLIERLGLHQMFLLAFLRALKETEGTLF